MKQDIEVRHHNAITTARYEYSELQMDLFFYLLSKLRKDDTSGVYEIVVKDLSKLTGKTYAYSYLRKATEAMGSRMFEVLTEKSYKQLWMFQHIEYITGQGRIEVKLSESIRPYLFDLKDNFTSYELAAALRLTSKHAKRLYPICSQWKDRGETPKYDLHEFKKVLGLVDAKGREEYTKITMLKAKVLDIAVRQINEHTDLTIRYALEKKGRAFQYIVFTITPRTVATLPVPVATAEPLPGVQPSHLDNAARVLDELRITSARHRQTILSSAAHVAEVNRYNHDLRTGKIKATRNAGGLLLVRLGLVAPKDPKRA